MYEKESKDVEKYLGMIWDHLAKIIWEDLVFDIKS